MDRAKLLDPFAMRDPGAKAWATPWSFFLTLCHPGKKGDRCLWLGNGLHYGHMPSDGGLGSRESIFLR